MQDCTILVTWAPDDNSKSTPNLQASSFLSFIRWGTQARRKTVNTASDNALNASLHTNTHKFPLRSYSDDPSREFLCQGKH